MGRLGRCCVWCLVGQIEFPPVHPPPVCRLPIPVLDGERAGSRRPAGSAPGREVDPAHQSITMRTIFLVIALGALSGCAGTGGANAKRPARESLGAVPVKSEKPPLSARKKYHDQMNDALAYKGMTTVEGDVSR